MIVEFIDIDGVRRSGRLLSAKRRESPFTAAALVSVRVVGPTHRINFLSMLPVWEEREIPAGALCCPEQHSLIEAAFV